MLFTDKDWWRFWSKVQFGDGCWEWTGSIKKPSKHDSGGRTLEHGHFRLWGRIRPAHRVALAIERNVNPDELSLVAHECDNPRCVRPSHLRESNHSANLQDAYDRGRRASAKNLDALCAWFDENPIAEAAE